MLLLLRLYGVLLKAYPSRFQAEFGAELQHVFSQALADAAGRGPRPAAALCLRELRDWPAAAAREHWRERRRHTQNHSHLSTAERPIPWLALLAVLAVFLVPALSAGPLMLVVLAGVLVGLAAGWPRWSLPYAGAAVSLLVLTALSSLLSVWDGWLGQLYRRLVNPADMLSRVLWQFHLPVLFWLGMLAALGIIVGLCALVPPLRPFYQRLRGDWTLAPFLLYGGALVMFLIDFDDYQHELPAVLLCMLWLAGGAWAYLHGTRPWQRLAALLAGATLAMATMGVGKWLIVPLQDWPFWFTNHTPESERWFEALRAIPAWLTMLAALAVTALAGRGVLRADPKGLGDL